MKKLLIFSCLACISLFFFTNASNKVSSSQINLIGTLGTGGPIRNLPPVEAYQTASDILLVFNGDLGQLEIEVVDENGVAVFQTTKNATVGSNLTIDIDGWKCGEYTLLIEDDQGGSLEGVFMID